MIENPNPNPPPGIWVGQHFHFLSLSFLLLLVLLAWLLIGQPLPTYYWLAVAFPVAHQIFVWLTWRWELSTSGTSKTIGFRGYLAVFFVLFGGRFASLFVLAWLDRGSLGINNYMATLITILLVLPGMYAMYSVARYFGMTRAAGADHFDPKYRDLPLVNEGIFRFTNNGMYVYAFLLFWAIAIGLNSLSALFVVAFSHLYIWVHFFATEKPDMEFLYGDDG